MHTAGADGSYALSSEPAAYEITVYIHTCIHTYILQAQTALTPCHLILLHMRLQQVRQATAEHQR